MNIVNVADKKAKVMQLQPNFAFKASCLLLSMVSFSSFSSERVNVLENAIEYPFGSEQTLVEPNEEAANDVAPYIIGGSTADRTQFKFYARLALKDTKSYKQLCGGSILNDRFILTAAHCVDDLIFTGKWRPSDLRVIVKNTRYSGVMKKELKRVKNIHIHPGYSSSSVENNDIAVIELAYPITDNVGSITLPSDQDKQYYEALDKWTVAGLGYINDNQVTPSQLQKVDVYPESNQVCRDAFNVKFYEKQSICTRHRNASQGDYTNACQGDSGGPLSFLSNNGTYQQMGVVSYGGMKCMINAPVVYTNIHFYKEWVNSKVTHGSKLTYDSALDDGSFISDGDGENSGGDDNGGGGDNGGNDGDNGGDTGIGGGDVGIGDGSGDTDSGVITLPTAPSTGGSSGGSLGLLSLLGFGVFARYRRTKK